MKDWAEFVKADDGTLGNFLNGKTTAGIELLKKLSRALNIPVEEIDSRQIVERHSNLLRDAEFGSRKLPEPDSIIRFLLDHMSEKEVRASIDKALDSGRYEVARFLIDFAESKWPSGGMKR